MAWRSSSAVHRADVFLACAQGFAQQRVLGAVAVEVGAQGENYPLHLLSASPIRRARIGEELPPSPSVVFPMGRGAIKIIA